MKRCKTCKHWGKPEISYIIVDYVGNCNAVPQFFDATEWDNNYLSIKPEHVGKLAFVEGADEYHAQLRTLPDFGCVQHEEII